MLAYCVICVLIRGSVNAGQFDPEDTGCIHNTTTGGLTGCVDLLYVGFFKVKLATFCCLSACFLILQEIREFI